MSVQFWFGMIEFKNKGPKHQIKTIDELLHCDRHVMLAGAEYENQDALPFRLLRLHYRVKGSKEA